MSEQMENAFEKTQSTGGGRAMDINKKLIFNMRDLSHVMRSLYEGKASQERILIVLNEVKSITQRDLTMRLGIQPGSASEILSKLENAGFILRTMSETDRRTANISLTEQGARVACEAAEQRSRRHVEMFSCLTDGEKEELLALLEKVNADWTRRYGADAEGRRQKCRMHRHECGHGHGDDYEGECGPGHRHREEGECVHRHERGEESECGHRHERGEEGECGHRHEHGHGGGHGHGDKHAHGHDHAHEHNHGDEFDLPQGMNQLETEESTHVVEVH